MGEKMKKAHLSYLVSLCDAGGAGEGKMQAGSPVDSPPYFCTTNNMQSAVVYLSQELQGLGLNCGLIETGSQKVNLVALINACWEVSRLYRSSVRDCSTLQDQRRRDAADMNHFQNTIRDLRGTVDDKERQICDAQERERQAVSINKALATKLKSEKEEVRRLGSVLQQREAHHQHELRKKETENSRLRERLHRLVSGEKTSETRAPGMSISNTLSRTNRSRAKWRTEASGIRHEEDMHRKVLSQYEAWVGQLSDENEQLKSCLSSLNSQISKLATKFNKNEIRISSEGEINTSMNSSTFSTDSLDDPMFNLDFPAFRDQVQQNLDENLKLIVQAAEEKTTEQGVDVRGRDEVKALRSQLAKVKEQLRSYHQYQQKGGDESKTEMTFLMDGDYLEERAEVEREKQELATERKSLQQEREAFSEAAIRLNRERVAFEAEKVELLKRQFLQDLPNTLNDLCTADVMTSGHESGGSLSSGSLGEVFSDSPHRILAVPEITPPRGNVTMVRGSQPVVLGPTMLPKQQRNEKSGSGVNKNALYRLKSAPASRASSVPRFAEEVESKSPCSKAKPPQTRPRTLERLKRKPLSGSSTPKYRSRSQSRLEMAKDDDDITKRKVEYSSSPARAQGEALLRSMRTDGREVIYPPITVNKDGLNYLPSFNRIDPEIVKASTKFNKVLSYSPEKDVDSEKNRFDADDDEDSLDNKGLTFLETDLMNLMAQIGQNHDEMVIDSCSDNSPAYEESTFLRKPSKRNVNSIRTSAPGSLYSSRRSSREVSDEYCKGANLHFMKKPNP